MGAPNTSRNTSVFYFEKFYRNNLYIIVFTYNIIQLESINIHFLSQSYYIKKRKLLKNNLRLVSIKSIYYLSNKSNLFNSFIISSSCIKDVSISSINLIITFFSDSIKSL